MNVYSLFLPRTWKTASTDATQATLLAQTVAYLLHLSGARNIAKSLKTGTVQQANQSWGGLCTDVQTVGSADAAAATPGTQMMFATSMRLPTSLDDNSSDNSGRLYGTPSNANGAVPRLLRVSTDDQDSQAPTNLLRPYAMAGDMVVAVTPTSLLDKTVRQVTLLPLSASGQGVYVLEMNADSADGVNPDPLSAALGSAIIGAPRQVAVVGTDLIAVNPNSNRTASKPMARTPQLRM